MSTTHEDSAARRRDRRPVQVAALILMLTLVLAACTTESEAESTTEPTDSGSATTDSDSGSATTDTEPASADAGPSGSLTVAVIQEVQSMDAQITFKEVNATGIRNVIETLTWVNPDTGDLEPRLATSWEQIEPQTWRFELREGITFHDGSPFNGESAAFLVNWVWDPENLFGIREANAGLPISAEAVDEYTIDVFTEFPDPLLPARLSLSGITSMQQIQEDIESVSSTAIGTGPYRFVEWETGSHWEAEVNPDWWALDLPPEERPGVFGEQLFETVRFVFRPEPSVRTAMLEAGEADLSMFLGPDECAAVDAASDTYCLAAESDTYVWFRPDFHGAHPALEDPRVREAMFSAVDWESIVVNVIEQGTLQNGQMLGEGAVGYVADLDPYPYDPEHSRQLLDEARADGVDVDGLTVHIATRLGSSPRNGEVIEAIGAFLTDVGINNTVQVEEPAVFNEWLIAPATEARANVAVHTANFGILDYALTLGAGYTCGSQLSVYCNPEFDDDLVAASELSGDERHQALGELVSFLRDEYVMAPVVLLDRAYGLRSDIEWVPGVDQRIEVVNMRRR